MNFVPTNPHGKYRSNDPNLSGRAGQQSRSHYLIYEEGLAEFRTKNRIEQCIPGLTSSRLDIVAAIENIQHWNAAYSWLPDFMDLNNENKHQRLTPQERREAKELKISSGGAQIGIGEGASISIGHGASITIGGVTMPGGQTVEVNHPPFVQGMGTVEVITWVSFHFASNNAPVLPFLKTSIQGARKIISDLSAL